jgi:hypothetical protein
MAVSIDGGSVDLARRPESAGGSSGAAVPLRVALDRLQISDGLALAPFRGEMSAGAGLSGTFEARVNGGAQVRGALAPADGATAIQITAEDGGAVLRDAGIYPNAQGGLTATTRAASPSTACASWARPSSPASSTPSASWA